MERSSGDQRSDGPAQHIRQDHERNRQTVEHEFDGEMKNLIFEQISWCKLGDLAELDFLDGDRPLIEKLGVEGEAAFAGT